MRGTILENQAHDHNINITFEHNLSTYVVFLPLPTTKELLHQFLEEATNHAFIIT